MVLVVWYMSSADADVMFDVSRLFYNVISDVSRRAEVTEF